jgi:hypothetical protein
MRRRGVAAASRVCQMRVKGGQARRLDPAKGSPETPPAFWTGLSVILALSG